MTGTRRTAGSVGQWREQSSWTRARRRTNSRGHVSVLKLLEVHACDADECTCDVWKEGYIRGMRHIPWAAKTTATHTPSSVPVRLRKAALRLYCNEAGWG